MNFNELNTKQKTAVLYQGKHLLVLAGAGTGKTKTIISRALHLIQQGVEPQVIQILSFTRKSAEEIVSRINSLSTRDETKLLKGNTFHSWCVNIIRSYPKVFQCYDFTIIDKEDQLNIFKLLYGRNKTVVEETKLTPAHFLEVYSSVINTRINLTEGIRKVVYGGRKDIYADEDILKFKYLFEEVIKGYIDYKEQHNYLDYDDLLNNVVTQLQDDEELRKHITSKYKHILVDEVQDTNPLQWELLSLFQDNSHLFCVGDDAQSIYAFRGADFNNIHQFKNRIPNSEVLILDDNYRSTQPILDASNWLLEQSYLDYGKKLKAIRGSGEKPLLMNFQSDHDEASWIVDNILWNVSKKSKFYKDHLVLSRSVRGLRLVEAVLLKKQIPYQIFGGIQLLQSRHIKDVFSCLRILSNIRDEIAWMRYLQLWEGIGDVTASNLIEGLGRCENIEECLAYLKRQKKIKNPQLIQTLADIVSLENNPAKAIEVTVDNLKNRLSSLYKDDWDKREEDYQLLMLMANYKLTVGEFISDFTVDPSFSSPSLEEESDVLTLSTIHSAKGLEANVCYVLNVSPGSCPLDAAIGIDAIEEERRCLYVALTRAQDSLIVTRNIPSLQIHNKQKEEGEEDVYFFDELPLRLFTNQSDRLYKKMLNNFINRSDRKVNPKFNFS